MRQRREQGRKKCLLWCMRVGEKCYQTHCSGSTTCAQEKRHQAEKTFKPQNQVPPPRCLWVDAIQHCPRLCVAIRRECFKGVYMASGCPRSMEGPIKHLHHRREVKRERGEWAFRFTDTNAMQWGRGRPKETSTQCHASTGSHYNSTPIAFPTVGK